MNILIGILLGIDMLVALVMILVILMQRPKSEGLGAAFGGGVTENIFGAQTTNVLVKFTGWLAGIFFVVTFLLSILYTQRTIGGSNVRRELQHGANATASPAAQSPSPAASASAKPADLAVGAAAQQPSVTATPAPSVAATPPRVP